MDLNDLQKTLERYCDVRQMSLEQGLEKRMVSVASKIIALSKQDAQPTAQEIQNKVESLGFRVKIRPSIRRLKIPFASKVKLETKARVTAIGYTRYGWLFASSKLKAKGRTLASKFGNSIKGGVRRQFGGSNEIWIELYNGQPAAALMDQKHNLCQRAIDADVVDMTNWLNNKLQRQAERNGLK